MAVEDKSKRTVQRLSLGRWTAHWTSALLAFFLLATSLGSGLGIVRRPFPASWIDWHLTAGIALLTVTFIRVGTMRSFGSLRQAIRASVPGSLAINYWLLLLLLADGLTGLAIYQRPPFGRGAYLFRLLPMPTLLRLEHSLHNTVIIVHIALSSFLLLLIAVHIGKGLNPTSRSALSRMLWPWRQRYAVRPE